MSDAEHKRAQTEPLKGESKIHFRGKLRIHGILSRCAFFAELEHRFLCDVHGLLERIEIRSDVYGAKRERSICCEVNGPGGHKTARAFAKDNTKKRLICEQHNIDPKEGYFIFPYKHIIGRKAWSDKEICEEMNITIV